jgi:hypothetical protein
MTALTAATRDGGQSNEAAASGASTRAPRIAATMLRLTPLMLPLVLAACGGGSEPGLRDPSRLAPAVRARLEQRLMEANPREGSAASKTHVTSVDCSHEDGPRYRCSAEFGDGTHGDFLVLVGPDGRRFRFG